MAIRVPVGPTVDPSTRPLSPSTPEGVFGVAGDVLGAVGKTAGNVSDLFAQHAEKMAAIDNRVAADGAVIKGAEAADQFMLDFKSNNQGMAASQNLTSAYKRLEDIRAEAGAGLMSPAARDLYNSQSRIAGLQARQHLAGFAAQERLTYLNQEADSGIKLTARSLTPENFAAGSESLKARVELKGDINGWGPEQRQEAYADAIGDAAYNVTAGMAVSSPGDAQTFYDAHKDAMTPAQRTAAENLIHSSVQNFTVMNTVDAAVAANSVGGPTSLRAAIAGIESAGSGGYKAVGPVTKSGDRAYGKYQVMGANIPKWTEQVLGKRMTPQQFLADPAAQDKVFDTIFGGYAQKYGPQEAASLWFTGRRMAEGAALKDVNGMTGAEYVRRFSAGLGVESPTERLVTSLPQQLAQFDATIPNPVLREKVKTEYLQRVTRERSIDTAISTEAQNNLLQAALANNITDPARLQQAYPGALEDWNRLSPKAQIALTNSLTARGNQWDPVKEREFNRVMGMAQTRPQEFLLIDPSTLDLPHGARAQIATAQRAMQKKSQMDTFKSVNLSRALSNPYVKRGTEGLAPDDYDVFVGALNGELEQWAATHPGKKPSDAEIGQMGYNLLAQQKRPAGQYVFGVRVGSTEIERPAFSVPPQEAATITEKYKARFGREPEPDEIARIYAGAN